MNKNMYPISMVEYFIMYVFKISNLFHGWYFLVLWLFLIIPFRLVSVVQNFIVFSIRDFQVTFIHEEKFIVSDTVSIYIFKQDSWLWNTPRSFLY